MSDSKSGHHPSERPPIGGASVRREVKITETPAHDEDASAGGIPKIDVNEYGAERDGERQVMNRRLFMQLYVFHCDAPHDPARAVQALVEALTATGAPAVVYEDVNDPRGVGVLTWSENPDHFVTTVRPIFVREGLSHLRLRPEMTMLGRTYSGGYEQDLEFWILKRPHETALNPEWPWHVWYPLRRGGDFEKLEPREQGKILKEHAIIGRAYGAKGLAHDIRLACHGLDANDNEFVIGLIGAELHPLSHVVQTMRKTKQTSTYIVQMGPFFVGRVAGRSPGR